MQSTLRSQSTEPFLAQQASNSIEVAAAGCRDSLQQCLAIPTLMQLEWAENRLAEFKLWAATSGALAGGAASLDARLTMESDTKNLVRGLLVLLSGCLGKCKRVALFPSEETEEVAKEADEVDSAPEDDDDDEWWANDLEEADSQRSLDAAEDIPRGFSPWSDDSSSSRPGSDGRSMPEEISPLAETKAEVEQIINHLTRVALAIRKSGTTSRLHKADRSFDPSNHGQLRRHLELVLLARGRRDGRKDYHIDSEALTDIQERLILVNLRRRNRYAYAQKHAKKLAVDSTSSNDKGGAAAELDPFALRQSHPAITTPAIARMTEARSPQMLGQDEDRLPVRNVVLTATSASGVAQTIDAVPERTPTPSRVAKTNITTTAAKVLYPRPPRSKVIRYFQCPCCCQTLPDLYREKTLWKKHLMADICPYTCILAECPTPERLYVTRHEWTRHIEKQHGQCWKCPACSVPGKPPVIFPSVDTFLHHLREAHSESINEEQYSTIVAGAARPVPPGICRCPLCESSGPADSPDLLDHIAEHLHDFALRSLPWSEDRADTDDARDPRDPYFNAEDYFDQESENNSLQDMSVDSDRDSGGLASLSTNSSGANFVPDSTPGPSEGPFEYTAGWICGFDTEFTAAKAFLEKTHTDPPLITPNDRNSHACGRIGSLNVVIAMPPDGEYGAAAVATLAENMLRNFPHLRMGLMVGIGGGAPSSKHDVRLGDVVVSHKDEVPSGILHLDLAEKSQVKAVSSDDTDPRLKLSVALKEGIARMQDFADMDDGQMDYYIDRALERLPPPVNRYSRPPRSSDRLYRSDFLHLYLLGDCGSCGDDPDRLVSRETREKDAPAIHYGVIATSGRLISDASVRDNLAEKGILCFDLLAAGLQNYFPCVVIRGICDYLDSHRTQEWHGFASITAAAYAARLLRAIDPKSVEADVRMVDTVSPAQPNSETTKQNLATVENRTSGIDEDLEHEIRLWLSPPDPSTNLEEARAAVIEGTGAWFLEGDTFSEWKSGKMQQLFLFGNPGSGKTLLSTMLVDHLRQDTGSTTIFFFFDSRDTGKQTFDSLLRSLAWQLYRTEIRSRKRLRKFHSNCRSNICRSDTRELAVAVKDMMRLSGGANIVIDAVDECTTADEFLWWLESFYSTQSLAIFKFIVTGRPTLELLHRVPTFFGIENCLALAQDAETFNITRTYVDKRLKEDQSFVKKSLSQDLVDAIRIRVEYVDDGRFRWTVCQLDILAICGSPDAIRSALENMPRTLDEAYRYVLQNIPDNHRSDVIRLLQVLVHLSGPLTSSAATDIMATRIDTAPPGFEDHVRLDSGNDLLRNYPSLVPFISPTPNEGVPKKIQLSNSSVRDILLGEGQFQRATGDITITLTALAYMKDIKETPEKTLEDFPFAELAAGIINVFTKHAEADDGVFSEILSFSRNPAALHRWYRCLDRFDHISDPPTPLSPLYFPCRAGLLRAVIRLLQDGVDVNEGNGTEFDALYVSSRMGHGDIVRILLNHGADVNAGYDKSCAALQVASQFGYPKTVKILLEHGAKTEADNEVGNNPLVLASTNGHVEVVKLLLESGAQVKGGAGPGSVALIQASGDGHFDVVQLLLGWGGGVYDANDRSWGEAIQAATEEGHDEIVQLLQEARLCKAASMGDYDTVKALLDEGVDLEATPGGGSALDAAERKGHTEIVKLLLERGADRNPPLEDFLESSSSVPDR